MVHPTLKYLSLLFCFSFISFSAYGADPDEDLPWMKKPDQTARPTKDNPTPQDALSQVPDCEGVLSSPEYRGLAQQLAQIDQNPKVREVLQKIGLTATTVSWQDTGRYHGSSGGNNISDVRLAALTRNRDGQMDPIAQPIVRLPNFEDKTVDVKMDEIFVPAGNAWDVQPFAVSLKDMLTNIQDFLSWREKVKGSLYDEKRDSQVLVSAQAAIMPVPKNGEAHFVPTIYNYQSTEEHPAVLVILVSNRGTSVTVIDNTRDRMKSISSYGAGQMLFHNKNGEKAPFVLQSRQEVMATKEGQDRIKELENSGQNIAGQSGANQVMMIQVPLKHPPRQYGGGMMVLESFGGLESAPMPKAMSMTRGLDEGVVDVARYTLGRFVELDERGSELERDTDLPIRVDVIRWMATDTAELTEAELTSLGEQLRGVYTAGSNLGSLVTDDKMNRVTRNYQPWRQSWWNVVVVPYIPLPWQDQPWKYWEKIYGPYWMFRFANEELARRTVLEAASNK